ncbi:MAG: hypothetical protein JWP09_167 [Candidatus Taylorbacteria bacterium]|nr:hypothetical protein [Candidatus Taylorbacteria bacterium]
MLNKVGTQSYETHPHTASSTITANPRSSSSSGNLSTLYHRVFGDLCRGQIFQQPNEFKKFCLMATFKNSPTKNAQVARPGRFDIYFLFQTFELNTHKHWDFLSSSILRLLSWALLTFFVRYPFFNSNNCETFF